jgi:hypothetical protein
MAITYNELLDRLKQEEETLLVEVLEIRSEDIVNRFEDFISNKLDYLIEEYEDQVMGSEFDDNEEETYY